MQKYALTGYVHVCIMNMEYVIGLMLFCKIIHTFIDGTNLCHMSIAAHIRISTLCYFMNLRILIRFP